MAAHSVRVFKMSSWIFFFVYMFCMLCAIWEENREEREYVGLFVRAILRFYQTLASARVSRKEKNLRRWFDMLGSVRHSVVITYFDNRNQCRVKE